MAVSPVSNMVVPLPKFKHHQLRSENPFLVSLFGQKSQISCPNDIVQLQTMITRSKRNTIIKRVMSKTSEHLPSIITNHETPKEEEVTKEEEMEKQSSLAESWRHFHGLEDWTGMLDPMDPLLRAELIRYGEMAQACYDAFDFDPFSKYCGSCKFTRKEFFQGLEMTNQGYEVTRYHGKGQRFVLASGRDPALVNKACDFLKDHYMVLPFWRQDHNKGMVRNYDGRWIQAERPIHEDHPTDMHHHLCRLGLISDHL